MLNTVNTTNGTNGHINGHNGNGHTNSYLNKELYHHHLAAGSEEKPAEKLAIEAAVRTILNNVGEDASRDGLVGTPDRIARMYDEVLGGYQVDPVKLVNGALFDVEYGEMVLVKDIEYFSMCEHHMLPFFGRAHVAYLPTDKVIGLSKIPRLVEMFARRLQVQERMTHQIAEMLDDVLAPRGIAVAVEGQHMCSMMRGVKKEHPVMFTSAFLGEFQEDRDLRKEFLDLVR
jgi:GTP cyclohydrolase I